MLVFSTAFVNCCLSNLLSGGRGGGGILGHMRGGGPQTDKTPSAKSLYRAIFLDTTFDIAFYQCNLTFASISSEELSSYTVCSQVLSIVSIKTVC